MFGLNDILLGGLVPLAAAASFFAIGWAASRRPVVAWPLSVIVGYAAGVVALEAQNVGCASALKRLAVPAEAKHWLPSLAALALLPSVGSALARGSKWPHWLLAALLAATVPV